MMALIKMLTNRTFLVVVGCILLIFIVIVVGLMFKFSLTTWFLVVVVLLFLWIIVLLHKHLQATRSASLLERSIHAQADEQKLSLRTDKREEIEQLSQNLGIQGYCRFPGFVPKSGDLPGIFRLADVFVTASEIEIQSSVVLEAMASGNPVVTVEASSMPEFVSEGVNGYLVPPGDVEAMAGRLISLLSESLKAKGMGKAGRSIAAEHSNERFVGAHEQLYESIAITA